MHTIPRKAFSRRGWIAATCAILTLAAGGGCGSGAYENRLQARLVPLRKAEAFYLHLYPAPTPIYGEQVLLRYPNFIDAKETDDAQYWRVGKPNRLGIASRREELEPPMMALPGFQFNFEKYVPNDKNRMMPVYLYVGIVEIQDGVPTAQEIMDEIMRHVEARFVRAAGEDPPAWVDASIPTPEDGTNAFKLLQLKGMQRFDLTPFEDNLLDLAGRFDLYLHSTADYHVLIGWRAPDEVAPRLQFFEKARTAMGTLRVQPK
jgi:hypothetical protein